MLGLALTCLFYPSVRAGWSAKLRPSHTGLAAGIRKQNQSGGAQRTRGMFRAINCNEVSQGLQVPWAMGTAVVVVSWLAQR